MASQTVSYFIISVCGLIQAPLLSPCILAFPRQYGMSRNKQGKKGTEEDTKKRELHELPYTEIVNPELLTY